MVDFRKLRSFKAQQPITDPLEIFRRLPKPPEIVDLYTSQSDVLREWYKRQDEQDLVIKLHTGGGKTLVGLLIGQSILNKTHKPVIYLAPTNQLVTQISEMAKSYNISTVLYDKNKRGEFPDEFLNGVSTLVCTYHALFNAQSRFGVRGGGKEIIHVAGIILDDAHVTFSAMRDLFTLTINKSRDSEGYAQLTQLFRKDFEGIGKLGTFDDMVNVKSSANNYDVLEVPYWSWRLKSSQVRDYFREKSSSNVQFVWPFLRNSFDYCHCFITHESLAVTPFFPLVDAIPTFAECPRRIFMSATIGDDSTVIRTFGANISSVKKPITSISLTGVSERMILIPENTKIPQDQIDDMLHQLAKTVADTEKAGTIILVPSKKAAQKWKGFAQIPSDTEEVETFVKQLKTGSSKGPFVFINRYDGIDLPDEACRLLIMNSLPYGMSEYELYRASIFMDATTLNNEIMQRIEQGMGRGARGRRDYCVVILTGRDLVSRLGRHDNQKALTASTRAQLEIGLAVSENVENVNDFVDTIKKCLKRDPDWVLFHQETLADLTEAEPLETYQLELANIERKAFQLMRDHSFERAINLITAFCEQTPVLDAKNKGWLYQFAACIASLWDNEDIVRNLQKEAYANNHNLFRPQVPPPYMPLSVPSQQAESIVECISQYKQRRSYMAHFENIVSNLVVTATSNQFEEALSNLGTILGFRSERPDKIYHIGPDVLWLLNDHIGMVMEAKHQKKLDKPLKKDEHGQLLDAEAWFKKYYPSFRCIAISVHPNASAEKISAEGTFVLTLDKLQQLVSDTRLLLDALTKSLVSNYDLVTQCEQLLASSHLTSYEIASHYFTRFKTK